MSCQDHKIPRKTLKDHTWTIVLPPGGRFYAGASSAPRYGDRMVIFNLTTPGLISPLKCLQLYDAIFKPSILNIFVSSSELSVISLFIFSNTNPHIIKCIIIPYCIGQTSMHPDNKRFPFRFYV